MVKHIFLYIALFIVIFSCDRIGLEKLSSEYYKYTDSFLNDYVTIYEKNDTINSYKSINQELLPPPFFKENMADKSKFQIKYDSLLESLKFYDYDIVFDSLMLAKADFQITKYCTINNISFNDIIRYDSLDNLKVIVYLDSKYSEKGNGYWISVSKDNGVTWRNAYTGIVKGYNLYLKPNPTINLFLNKKYIQIESAIIQETKPQCLPCGSPEYGLVKDGLLTVININKVYNDRDNDGLTDIEENITMTDPNCIDTDDDGINDNDDCNPRFKNEFNEYTLLYKFFLESKYHIDSCFIEFKNPDFNCGKESVDLVNHKRLIMLVTDDYNLQHLSGTNDTYIILTNKEFVAYKKIYRNHPYIIKIIPLKKTKHNSSEYSVSFDFKGFGSDYIVTKTKTGWKIKSVGGYIC